MPRPEPLLAATLIVRDEEADLAECLASLAPAVDEFVVYDTGSLDGTAELARRAGARVCLGYWDGDFSRARTEAFAMTRAQWALVVDADERLSGDPHQLRRLLLGTLGFAPPVGELDAFAVPVVSLAPDDGPPAAHSSIRLVRPRRGRWQGRVHETFVLDGGPARIAVLPAGIGTVRHLGYADPERLRRKGERNLALAQAELDALVAAGSEDREAGGRVLFDLARSFLVLGLRQDAVDALETLRDLAPPEPRLAAGTALLAQVLLDAGGFEEVALVLADELAAGDAADPRHVAWLRAQAAAGLGYGRESLELLRGIDAMGDPFGTPLPMGRVLRARAVLAAEFGLLDEARDALERLRGPGGPPVVDVLTEIQALLAA